MKTVPRLSTLTLVGALALAGPARPDDQRPFLTLKENLVIGGEADEANGIAFSQIAAIQADDDGNIYVLDYKECLVKVFDAQGKLIRSFGKKGQGPGDLQVPAGMSLSGDVLTIFDLVSSRISRFSLEGRPIEDIDLISAGSGLRPIAEASGSVFCSIPDSREDGMMKVRLIRFCRADKRTHFIAATSIGSLSQKKASPLKLGYCVQPLPDGRAVWVDKTEYSLNFLTPNGTPDFCRTKEHKRIRVTEQYKKEQAKPYKDSPYTKDWTLEWPEFFPPIMNIVAADNGWIIVMNWPADRGRRQFDIFGGPKWEYLGNFYHPEGEFLISVKSNMAYFQAEDEGGYPVVKRYAIELTKK